LNGALKFIKIPLERTQQRLLVGVARVLNVVLKEELDIYSTSSMYFREMRRLISFSRKVSNTSRTWHS